VIDIRVQGGAVLLRVKIVPGASRTAILGEWNGRLRIAVAAAPQKGKANAALTAFLAKKLSLPKARVEVAAGAADRLKTIRIVGIDAETVRAVLQG